jgi:hypothetical protein
MRSTTERGRHGLALLLRVADALPRRWRYFPVSGPTAQMGWLEPTTTAMATTARNVRLDPRVSASAIPVRSSIEFAQPRCATP